MISDNVKMYQNVIMSLKKSCASKPAGHMLLRALVESFWVKYVQHMRMHAINFTGSAFPDLGIGQGMALTIAMLTKVQPSAT